MSDMPFRGLKSSRKRAAFSTFSRKQDELAKRTYRAKRVHLLRMNTHPFTELPVAKRG